MDWDILHHHLYTGIGIGFVGLGGLAVALGRRRLKAITIWLIVIIVGFTIALDDAFQHWLGWNTPIHRLDVWLKKKSKWYRKFRNWLERR